MTAKPIGALELHYPMGTFLIITFIDVKIELYRVAILR